MNKNELKTAYKLNDINQARQDILSLTDILDKLNIYLIITQTGQAVSLKYTLTALEAKLKLKAAQLRKENKDVNL